MMGFRFGFRVSGEVLVALCKCSAGKFRLVFCCVRPGA